MTLPVYDNGKGFENTFCLVYKIKFSHLTIHVFKAILKSCEEIFEWTYEIASFLELENRIKWIGYEIRNFIRPSGLVNLTFFDFLSQMF